MLKLSRLERFGVFRHFGYLLTWASSFINGLQKIIITSLDGGLSSCLPTFLSIGHCWGLKGVLDCARCVQNIFVKKNDQKQCWEGGNFVVPKHMYFAKTSIEMTPPRFYWRLLKFRVNVYETKLDPQFDITLDYVKFILGSYQQPWLN